MNWVRDVLIKYKKEIIQSTITSFVIALVFLLYTYFIGNIFTWHKITPIEQPSILDRYFYSAFTFSTIGAFLFFVVKLWKGLYFIFVKVLGMKDLYILIKALLWFGLVLVSYFYLVPFTINVLNNVISFFFNIINFILYLSPTLGIFLILSIIGVYFLKEIRSKPIILQNETLL
jgi:hypothetical protein